MPQPLIGGPRQGLDPAEVADALSLTYPPTVRHGVDVLDRDGTLTDVRLGVTEGSVSWQFRAPEPGGQQAAAAAVRRTATLEVVGNVPDLTTVYLRPWTQWRLPSGWARFHLGVFTVTDPGAASTDGTIVTRTLQCADKSHGWTDPLDAPLWLPGTTVAVEWVKARLAEWFGQARFAIAGNTDMIGQPRTFEPGTSRLEVLSRVLEAVGLDQLTVDEDGLPASQSLTTLAGRGPFVSYGPGEHKLYPEGSVQALLPHIPNVVLFSARQGPSLGNVEGNGLRTVKNVATGPASITARGREVVHRVEADVDSQAALDAYAQANAGRFLAGGGRVYTGKVALNPRLSDRDVIGLSHPLLGLSGEWEVTSWTYPLRPVTGDAVLMPITVEGRVR